MTLMALTMGEEKESFEKSASSRASSPKSVKEMDVRLSPATMLRSIW